MNLNDSIEKSLFLLIDKLENFKKQINGLKISFNVSSDAIEKKKILISTENDKASSLIGTINNDFDKSLSLNSSNFEGEKQNVDTQIVDAKFNLNLLECNLSINHQDFSRLENEEILADSQVLQNSSLLTTLNDHSMKDMGLIQYENDSILEKIKTLKSQIEDIKEKMTRITEAINELEIEYHNLENKKLVLESLRMRLNELITILDNIKELESEKLVMLLERQNLSKELNILQEELKNGRKQLKDLMNQRHALQKEIEINNERVLNNDRNLYN